MDQSRDALVLAVRSSAAGAWLSPESIRDLPCPSLCYVEPRVLENLRQLEELKGSFTAPEVRFAYAVKACALRPVLEAVAKTSVGFEVQSAHEMDLCLRVGAPGSRVIWNGPRKSRRDLLQALDRDVTVIVDNLSEGRELLELLRERSQNLIYGVRVASCLGEGAFVAKNTQFGFDEESCAVFLREAAEAGRPPRILHCHALARCRSPEEYRQYAQTVRDTWRKLQGTASATFETVDLGGGWDGRTRLERETRDGIKALVRAAHDVFRHEERPPKALIFEPGRFVVEDSALGLCSVVRTKTVGERRHVIVDLSTNLLIPLPLARFELVMPPQSGETFPTTICDGTCSPAGVFVRDVQAPRIAEGSRLALANCGAYTAALAEPFMEPPAPVLWCDSDGVHALVDREQMRAATDLVQGFESSVPSGVPSNSFEGAQE